MPLRFDSEERAERGNYRQPVPEFVYRDVFPPGEVSIGDKQHALEQRGYPDPDAVDMFDAYGTGADPTKTSPMTSQQAFEQAKLDPNGEEAAQPQGMISDTKPGGLIFPPEWNNR